MVLGVSYKYNSGWIYSRSDLVFLRDFIGVFEFYSSRSGIL